MSDVLYDHFTALSKAVLILIMPTLANTSPINSEKIQPYCKILLAGSLWMLDGLERREETSYFEDGFRNISNFLFLVNLIIVG